MKRIFLLLVLVFSLFVGSHGRTGIERLFMGSVTERVIGHTETAVLVVKI